MFPPGHTTTVRWHRLPVLAAIVLITWTSKAQAQQQESVLLNRIMHPNMDLHYDGFDKPYDTKASTGNRQATVHPFAFGRSATVKTGDGAFRARTFATDRGGYRTQGYAVKPATAVTNKELTQVDRGFATRSVDVHDDRAAGKTAAARQSVDFQKPFLVPGKRQDSIDELRQQKNLTVDQVREILNKNK